MASKKPVRRRKAAKLGLLATGGVVAAVAEVTRGKYGKHAITDAIRGAVDRFIPGLDPVTKAVAIIIVTQLVHTETNKMGINPDLKFARAF